MEAVPAERAPKSERIQASPGAIAVAISLQNFAEGLAIGGVDASRRDRAREGAERWLGAENAAEGYGIVGPLGGVRPSGDGWGVAGLVGGGAHFVGAMVRFSPSTTLELGFYALAGGRRPLWSPSSGPPCAATTTASSASACSPAASCSASRRT